MSAAEKWTPEHLRSPADRAIHLEQRRAQLLPIVDDLRRLAREMEAEVKEIGAIEGDLPGQARIRAWHSVKPLFSAADDVEKAISDLISFNGRFQKSYEDLPVKREEKRQRKAVAKGQGQQAIESPSAGAAPGPPEKAQFGDVFDGLRRGA
ncbi:hypothetical protein [Streptomyces acidiscabies]|uniref:Uncharacterized protein n=1 Tax=Streptomyces acidiscabies TaxID=42234 RepID=A0AAP6BKS7_9ACTN|nr:hypothetical protein [Streptomyces acidiscabies]MBZ3918121.1 hypothetical protein [Streptomyces acidiscabies]MDX2966430.1 hypothetical protein [Streptomyces acidiscabies]MDX3796376.1 hypothetical protein [Streptomyces acidiscabies]